MTMDLSIPRMHSRNRKRQCISKQIDTLHHPRWLQQLKVFLSNRKILFLFVMHLKKNKPDTQMNAYEYRECIIMSFGDTLNTDFIKSFPLKM